MNTFLTPNALKYTYHQIFKRAGLVAKDPNEFRAELNLDIYFGDPKDYEHHSNAIVIACVEPHKWWQLIEKTATISWLRSQDVVPEGKVLPIDDSIPVLFWGKNTTKQSQTFAELRENSLLIFHVDILSSTFFMLSRWEELQSNQFDNHGRFPAQQSVAYTYEFLERPIVDEYAAIFAMWLSVLRPEWRPMWRKPTYHISHDIDVVRRSPTITKTIKNAGADILKYRSPTQLRRTLRALHQPTADEYFYRIGYLADLSQKYGLSSEFYFMATEPSGHDNGYNPDTKPLAKLYRDLDSANHVVGFHPGYHTFNNVERLIEEKQRLENAVGQRLTNGRQHFLRFRASNTWKHWYEAGLKLDSTLGYAEFSGFRAGTSFPFQPFDIRQDQLIPLIEVPLIVMDVSLIGYRRLLPTQAFATAEKLLDRVYKVGGNFSLLWHNTSFWGRWQPYVWVYEDLLRQLATSENAIPYDYSADLVS